MIDLSRNAFIVQLGALLNPLYVAFKNRVLADGGEIDSQSDLNSYITMAKTNGIYDSIQFGMLGAYSIRTDGNTKYVTKVYSMDATPNDATQTTEVAQPYLSGFIAPNEKWGLKNPNGEFRYMTHPTISFAANEAWSVSTVLNNYVSNTGTFFGGQYLNAISDNSRVSLFDNITPLYNIKLRGENAVTVQIPSDTKKIFGKQSVITIVYDGNTAFGYINGNLEGSIYFSDSFSFYRIFSAHGLYGSISAHFIRNQALNPTQVAAEATKLRQIFPEIPSVQIGTQRWATSNCEMVATPMGNVIPEVQDEATWADSQNIYDTTYAATTGTADEKEQAALEASAMWCYYNNDPSLGAICGKLYNWFAVKLLQNDIDTYNTNNPATPWGWHVPDYSEFNTLATTLGGNSVAGGKMKALFGGFNNSYANNSSGFSAIASGARDGDTSNYVALNYTVVFFTSDIYRFYLGDANETLSSGYAATLRTYGYSLRLIKD